MDNKEVKVAFKWALIDRITTEGIMAIVSIILARIIAPDQYGIISLALIIVIFGDAFVNPGICSALVQKKDPEQIDYATVFWFNILISIVLYSLLFLFAPFIETFYNIENLGTVIRVLALKFPFGALASIQLAFVQKNFLFKRYFFVSLFGTLTAGALGIYMALNGAGVWSLVVYNLGNSAIDALLALVFISWKPTFRFSKERFAILFPFGGRILLVKLIDLFYEQLSGLVIGKKYSPEELALYDKGKRFPNMIIMIGSNALSDTLFPAFSNIQNEIDKVKKMVSDSIAVSLFVVMPCAMGLLACGDNFVSVVLTDKWIECVPFLRVMCIHFMCIPISTILYQAIKAKGRSDVILKLEISKKVYGLAIMITAFVVSRKAIYIAIGLAVSTIISLFVEFVVTKRILQIGIIDIIKENCKTVLIAFLMLFIVFSIGYIPIATLLLLMLQIVSGVVVYVGFSMLLKPKGYLFIRGNLRSVLRREKSV